MSTCQREIQRQEPKVKTKMENTNTNECSICMEELAKTTGSSTMACGHCFHIGCLARWLTKNETCPYCRHEANEHERFQELADDDSEEEYDSDDDEEEENEDNGEEWIRVGNGRWISVTRRANVQRTQNLEIPEYDEEAHALWVFRKTMELLESGQEIQPQKELPSINQSVALPRLHENDAYYSRLYNPHDGYETS